MMRTTTKYLIRKYKKIVLKWPFGMDLYFSANKTV